MLKKNINSSLSQRPAPKPRNWLLAKSRQWHLWGGLIAGIFLLIVGATGIVLNYKKPIFTALGLDRDLKEMKTARGSDAKPDEHNAHATKLTARTGFAAAPVSVETALALAQENLGDVALERIELKDENGTLLYKIKSRDGEELHVNAITGAHYVKGEYEKVKADREGTIVARSTDWGKIMLDLHTGKIGGEVGKAIMTFAAVVMLMLTFSGVYMWLKPLLIRRQNRKTKAHAVPSTPVIPAIPTATATRVAKPELAEV